MSRDDHTAATASNRHPHEPEIPPTLDAEGRCLICGLLVENDRLRDLLARVAHLERWASIGSIDSHVRLSPVGRELWQDVQEALRRV